VETEYNSPGVNVPTTDPTRVFPDLEQILSGNTNAATGSCPASNVECFSEFLPTSSYTGALSFRVTARDGKAGGGGVATADTTLTLAPGAGPFLVTSHADGTPRTGDDPDTVTWNVAGTNTVSLATSVRISLSVDGGLTFPHELVASTPNDGSQTVLLPDVTAAEARIKVEAVGNVFFDVNDASFEIEEGTGPPDTAITSGPAGPTNEPSPTFEFLSRAGATFECRLGSDPFAPCTSPRTIGPLADGDYTFEVQATEGGESDPTPALATFTVDTVAPDAPLFLAGPAGQTGDPTPTFTFEGEPDASFECRVDAASFAACTSPHTTAKVAAGAHTFEVRATDEAGNVGATSSRPFTYVLPPNTKIGKRTLKHAARTATFRFSGSGGIGARTFQCRLTGAKTTAAQRAWSKCAAPKTYRRLKPGLYTFHVRARDATGRVDPTPAKNAFRMRRV
jgi:hypothetical protein